MASIIPPTWHYVALKENGEKITGLINAFRIEEAVELIQEKGLFPVVLVLPKKQRKRIQNLAYSVQMIEHLREEGKLDRMKREGKIIFFQKNEVGKTKKPIA